MEDIMCVNGDWIDVLVGSIGKYIAVETADGIIRQGKISGFKYRHFSFNDCKTYIPIEIELNGDPNDGVPLGRIATLVIS